MHFRLRSLAGDPLRLSLGAGADKGRQERMARQRDFERRLQRVGFEPPLEDQLHEACGRIVRVVIREHVFFKRYDG